MEYLKKIKAERQILIRNKNPTKIQVDTEFDETYNIWRVKVELKEELQ